MKFDEFICLLGNMQDTPKQITDKMEVSRWTDGDWDRYYYVFEIGEDLRAEIVDGENHLWFGLFTWERLRNSGDKFWHDIVKDKDARLTYDEFIDKLAVIGVTIDAPDVLKKTVRRPIMPINISDEFFQSTGYDSDCEITIKRKYDTLGNVMRWMAAYGPEDYDKLTKENYKSNHAEDNMDLVNRYPDGIVITAGGDLCYYTTSGGKRCKSGFTGGKKYLPTTPFISIICDYAEQHWEDEVYVVSYYSGLQGLLAITVYDVENKNPLFSFTALEMYGDWRAR